VYIVVLALFSTSLAKEFWSLHWSNEDCSGQVVTAYKYLTCYQGQHNYCEGNTPTTTTYSSNVCGRQPSNTNQTAPDNCDMGIQVVCSDQAPDTLMLYYTDANDENCTTLAREVWQTKLDTCIASNREDSLYLIVRCNSTGYPWMTSCRDFTCEMDCTSPRPFQVITVAPGTCAGGILLNRPNICQPSSDEIQPTAADAPTQPESGNTSGTVSVLFAPDTWLQGIIVMVLQYLS
jgi:hypothetical protein